jgi:hypothetical protein
MQLKGKYFITLFGEGGEVKNYLEGNNIVTTNGKEALASLLYSCAATACTNTFKYIAVGTGSPTVAQGDTVLVAEIGRQTGAVSYVSGAIFSVTATLPAGVGTGNITEYGLFNSNTNGTMFSHDTENVIAKGSTDTLSITYQLAFN